LLWDIFVANVLESVYEMTISQ